MGFERYFLDLEDAQVSFVQFFEAFLPSRMEEASRMDGEPTRKKLG